MMNVGGADPLGAMRRIFDENADGTTGVKSSTSRKGLKDNNIQVNINVASTPQKANDKTIPASKGTRKALGDLSSSQVNTRIASTPRTLIGIKSLNTKQSTASKGIEGGDKTTSFPSFSLNINPVVAASVKVKESIHNSIQSELYSTRQSKYMDEDPYDYVMRTSSKAKVGLIPVVSSVDVSSINTNDFAVYEVKNEEYSCDESDYDRLSLVTTCDLQSLLDE